MYLRGLAADAAALRDRLHQPLENSSELQTNMVQNQFLQGTMAQQNLQNGLSNLSK